MTVTVSIIQSALTAVLTAKDHQSGLLVGFLEGANIFLLSAVFCSREELVSTRDAVNGMLPSPLAVVGAHVESQGEVAAVQRALGPTSSLVAIPAGDSLECFLRSQQDGTPVSVLPSASTVAAALTDSFIPVRCSLDLVLQVREPSQAAGAPTAAAQAPTKGAVAAAFEQLKQQACGDRVVYLAEAAGSAAANGQPAKLALPGAESPAAMGASWSSPLLLRPYCSPSSAGRECTAPTLRFDPGKGATSCAALHVDVLCYVPNAMGTQEAGSKVVRDAVSAQLDLMQRETETRGELAPLRALHFLPHGLPHHIALVYPLPTPSIEDDEEALLGKRMQLHRLLGLPTNRPLLRVANAVDFSVAAAAGTGSSGGGGVGGKPRLADVHAGLPPSSVGGSVHLIQGTYDYHHYMQDKFDDSGWGCAYRSLQTICSWFSKQLYTCKAVPSHREIQQTLVSIGDKQQGFIGSKQWIGAIELGFVLDTLLGVSCKVLTVASGADMPSKAREIAHHFDTQGTPIMIGGGVLAYTLLGIDFNERTGDCAFLILDPHYTGAEDLKRIHSGQWVAWKKLGDKAAVGGELFVMDAFYNLLCPQRPNTV